MARGHAQLFLSAWADDDWLDLSPDCKAVYTLVLSQHDLNHAGVIPLRPDRWAEMLSGRRRTVTEADVQLALEELEEERFVVLDRKMGDLLVRTFIRNDGIWRQPNLFIAAARAVKATPSKVLRAALRSELERLPLGELAPKTADRIRETLEPLLRSLPTPPGEPIRESFGEGIPEGIVEPIRKPIPEGIAEASGEPLGDPKGEGPVTGTGEEVGSSPSSSLRDEEPPADADGDKNTAAKPAREPRGTRVPDPFPSVPELETWFAENCPDVNIKLEHGKFMDHWRGVPGAKGRKLDWIATWRKWMTTAQQDAAQVRGRRGGPPEQVAEALRIPLPQMDHERMMRGFAESGVTR